MLEVHAQAEEIYFYPELLKLGERRHEDEEAEETRDAIGDHNDIRDGILEASRHEVGTDGWWSGVTAARKANDEHMGEEEHEGLADFRRYVDLDTRHRIAVAFVAYEAANVDRRPHRGQGPRHLHQGQLLAGSDDQGRAGGSAWQARAVGRSPTKAELAGAYGRVIPDLVRAGPAGAAGRDQPGAVVGLVRAALRPAVEPALGHALRGRVHRADSCARSRPTSCCGPGSA